MICAIILILTAASAENAKALIFAALLHEAAHILCALLFFGELPKIRAGFCGLRLCFTCRGSTAEKLLLSASGPLVNILLWLILPRGSTLAAYSLSLGIFNLIPAEGLDGGEICKALLKKLLPNAAAERLCRAMTALAVFLLFSLNCAVQLKGDFNLSLLLITLYLIIRTYGK